MQVPSIVQIPLLLHVIAGSQNTMNRKNDSYVLPKHFSSVIQWALSTSVTFPYHSQNFIIYTTTWWKIPNIFGNRHEIQFPTAVWFLTIGDLKLFSINFPCFVNWHCLNYEGNKIKLHQCPTYWKLILHIQYRNANPSPKRKRDW